MLNEIFKTTYTYSLLHPFVQLQYLIKEIIPSRLLPCKLCRYQEAMSSMSQFVLAPAAATVPQGNTITEQQKNMEVRNLETNASSLVNNSIQVFWISCYRSLIGHHIIPISPWEENSKPSSKHWLLLHVIENSLTSWCYWPVMTWTVICYWV